MSPQARAESRVRLVGLIGKFCAVKRQNGGAAYRKLLDVGETHLIFEGDPKAGGGRQTEIEELTGIQEIQYREEKSLRGPFR